MCDMHSVVVRRLSRRETLARVARIRTPSGGQCSVKRYGNNMERERERAGRLLILHSDDFLIHARVVFSAYSSIVTYYYVLRAII